MVKLSDRFLPRYLLESYFAMKSYVTLLLMCFVQSPLFADDSVRLAGMLASATGNGGLVTIPKGDYYLDGMWSGKKWGCLETGNILSEVAATNRNYSHRLD